MGSKPVSCQCSSMAPTWLPSSGFLPWILSLTFFDDGQWYSIGSWNKPFVFQVVYHYGFIRAIEGTSEHHRKHLCLQCDPGWRSPTFSTKAFTELSEGPSSEGGRISIQKSELFFPHAPPIGWVCSLAMKPSTHEPSGRWYFIPHLEWLPKVKVTGSSVGDPGKWVRQDSTHCCKFQGNICLAHVLYSHIKSFFSSIRHSHISLVRALSIKHPSWDN